MNEQLGEHKIDRAGWPDGPWSNEPDKLNWKTDAGLPGMIVRNELGALCGYVAVSADHLAYKKHYGELRVRVHGGLTYSAPCHGQICHVPAPGEPDDVWWFGFDCAHYQDLVPGMPAGFRGKSYRDVQFVRGEVEDLARALAELT